MDLLRQYVGGPKNRYKNEKYNLDLTYITPRMIAMAFPASGLEKMYRNPVEDVRDFFVQNHNNNYLVVNLSGREVDESILQNVLNYDWEDHQAPPIQMLFEICDKMSDFLNRSSDTVVAVHCNHGKGRTGTIVCCFLLYCNVFRDPDLVIEFYAKKRFEIEQGLGVTQPCQIQYIKRFNQILDNKNPYIRPKIIAISKIIFRGKTKHDILYIKAKNLEGQTIFSTKRSQSNTAYQKGKNANNIHELVLFLIEQKYFCGDCRFYIKVPSTLSSATIATYSFNTLFLEGNKYIIPFNELSPYSLRKTDNFAKDFEIQIQFKQICKECSQILAYPDKCKTCQAFLKVQQQKWKKIMKIVQKRGSTEQRRRQSMLGYHLKNNSKQTSLKIHQNIELQNKKIQEKEQVQKQFQQ